MKRLNIPSALTGLCFGLISAVFVYVFVPPPSTAFADSCDCPSVSSIKKELGCATKNYVKRACAASWEVEELVKKYTRRYCSD